MPQNSYYQCNRFGQSYSYQLKDIIEILTELINKLIPFTGYTFTYENTETKIDSYLLPGAFYFNKGMFEELTLSEDSEKVTTIMNDNIIMTTIDIFKNKNKEFLMLFLQEINLINDKEEYPEWLYEYNFSDDESQKNNIVQAKTQIKIQKDIIEQANRKIENNMYYKSILCTNSDELVTVVFNILEYVFDVSLKDFNDEKHEDFLLKKDSITYIGEIKGVTSNIKSEHISQLEVHYYGYLDKLQEEGKIETIKKILIMNYERNKDVTLRSEIHQIQKDLAIRNKTLIIDTKSLLTIYEKLQSNELSKSSVIKYLSTKSGLIDISKINE